MLHFQALGFRLSATCERCLRGGAQQCALRGVAHGDAGAHGTAIAYVSSRGGPHDDAHGDGHGTWKQVGDLEMVKVGLGRMELAPEPDMPVRGPG